MTTPPTDASRRQVRRARIGQVELALGVVTGLVAIVLGVAVVARADTGFGKVWAAALVVFGLVAVIGAVGASRPLRPGSPKVRGATAAIFVLLAAWCAAVGVVGATQESWIWGVVMALPVAYLIRALRGLRRRSARGAGR
ncbi:hypothetical protein [Actinotalea solisilvae]|uniref:hypothetical protein n=1 Tax=Actinotalea solisilvae TaxID=2072922 RepID=UPI0018F1C864|nr:hypothetical protein [Actinotalea solisilvae]